MICREEFEARYGMDDLNPGICRLVEWLNDMGYTTTDSGDGETHLYECDREYPYVVIRVPPSTAHIISKSLMSEMHEHLAVSFERDDEGNGPAIEVSYSPVDNVAVIQVMGLRDRDIWPDA